MANMVRNNGEAILSEGGRRQCFAGENNHVMKECEKFLQQQFPNHQWNDGFFCGVKLGAGLEMLPYYHLHTTTGRDTNSLLS